MRDALGRHLRHTDVLARLVRRPRTCSTGTAAARDSQPAFDRLTEIGLGAGTVDAQLVAAMLRRVARR